jgi:hypothetical protein
MHKATITQDIRGSPPAWGYVHQLFFCFIIFCQCSYKHRASKCTLHRTGDLHAPFQILLPQARSRHKASYNMYAQSLLQYVCTKPRKISYNRLYLALQVSHRMHKAKSCRFPFLTSPSLSMYTLQNRPKHG